MVSVLHIVLMICVRLNCSPIKSASAFRLSISASIRCRILMMRSAFFRTESGNWPLDDGLGNGVWCATLDCNSASVAAIRSSWSEANNSWIVQSTSSRVWMFSTRMDNAPFLFQARTR